MLVRRSVLENQHFAPMKDRRFGCGSHFGIDTLQGSACKSSLSLATFNVKRIFVSLGALGELERTVNRSSNSCQQKAQRGRGSVCDADNQKDCQGEN